MSPDARIVRVAFLGYGTVNRALHRLLADRAPALSDEQGLRIAVVGVASRRLGWTAMDAPDAACADLESWLGTTRPDVVCEAIALDPHGGEPALAYSRAILAHGIHLVSANKGPVVYGFRELGALAARAGCGYRFESAVMDGAPVFSLVRDCLPLAGLRGVRGVFTSTATVVLESVEQGGTIADGIAHAQRLGIAEADPSYDTDGWDSVVKLCAVANVLLGGDLRPAAVDRTGITGLDAGEVREAARAGAPWRLVGRVASDERGVLRARVAPERLASGDPLAPARGTSLVMHYDAEVFPGGLTVTSHDPDATTTAYGLLADLVRLVGSGTSRRA